MARWALTSYEELGRMLRQSMTLPAEQTPEHSPLLSVQASQPHSDSSQHKSPSQYTAQPVREGMISFRDLSYLQRSEFKVQGGQVGDHSSDISYNNICKQIDEGIKEGFHDTEIVCEIDMLINTDDLALTELKGFPQAHLREKNSTELFQELMCARQDENETPQQFLYHVMHKVQSSYRSRCLFTHSLPGTTT